MLPRMLVAGVSDIRLFSTLWYCCCVSRSIADKQMGPKPNLKKISW